MSPNRLRLILTPIFVALAVAILWWGRSHVNHVATARAIEQADRDAAAAAASAAAAATSAARATDAARRAWNAVAGSS